MYIENPKLRGSGILAAIPQTGRCPNGCDHCFFQSGRSYLEPLDENLPNMPTPEMAEGRIVRMNDGNDSNVDRHLVIEASKAYKDVFFNTALGCDLDTFPGSVVLTVNPGCDTNQRACLLSVIPNNLMFVRVRTNTWNIMLVDSVVDHYAGGECSKSENKVPVVLTFMAYYGGNSEPPSDIPPYHLHKYALRKRTLNEYWAITREAWKGVMDRYRDNPLVYSCGNEGVAGGSKCSMCGNCLREYYATRERMKGDVQ